MVLRVWSKGTPLYSAVPADSNDINRSTFVSANRLFTLMEKEILAAKREWRHMIRLQMLLFADFWIHQLDILEHDTGMYSMYSSKHQHSNTVLGKRQHQVFTRVAGFGNLRS